MSNDDRDQARRDDFNFMVLCAAKGNMSMYHLLRDKSLDPPKAPTPGEIEYESWLKELRK